MQLPWLRSAGVDCCGLRLRRTGVRKVRVLRQTLSLPARTGSEIAAEGGGQIKAPAATGAERIDLGRSDAEYTTSPDATIENGATIVRY
jgi:hypothetical protein